jgi:hypothetical protein
MEWVVNATPRPSYSRVRDAVAIERHQPSWVFGVELCETEVFCVTTLLIVQLT